MYHYRRTDNVTGEVLDLDDYELRLEPTPLRTAPIYTAYFNWSRLVVLGIIPFAMLVYLNAKIYQDIKARRNRKLNARHQQKKKMLKVQQSENTKPFPRGKKRKPFSR